MPSPAAPNVVPSSTLNHQEAELLLRLVHGRAGTTFAREAGSIAPNEGQPDTPREEVQPERTKLLVGEFWVTLDSKNRFAIPSALAGIFEHGESYLTATAEDCLWLFPGPEFRRIFSELQGAIVLSPSAVSLKSYFAGHSFAIEPDMQHRITVPPPLRPLIAPAEAKAPTRLVLSGSGNFVELWTGEKWNDRNERRKAE